MGAQPAKASRRSAVAAAVDRAERLGSRRLRLDQAAQQELAPGLGTSQVGANVQHLQLPIALQRQGREAATAELRQRPAAGHQVLGQHSRLGNAPSLLVMRPRQAMQHGQALASQRVSAQLGGTLRIASSQSFAQAWLARAVAAFVERHPAVAVDLQVSSQAVNLVEERIDLALRITNQLDPNLIARRLATCHSVLCAAPAYLARHGTPQTPAELARHNCLTYAYFGRSLWQFERDGEPSGVPVSGNISANESTVLLEASVAGAGISLQPLYAAAPLLRAGRLVQLLPQYRAEALGIHALYGSRRQMLPALRALLDFLAARLQGDPHWEEQLAP